MKIKEIEKQVGMARANIRYYEEEGLIHPDRTRENNYREYSEEDVRQLERIKVLRTLGVSIADIRDMQSGQTALDEVMEKRLIQISEEEKNLDALRKVCETMIQKDVSYEMVDEQVLEGESAVWKERMEQILTEDITKEILTPAQLNRNIGGMLCWGYFLNVVTALILGDLLLKYQGRSRIFPTNIAFDGKAQTLDRIFFAALILCIACYIVIYFTSNIKTLLVTFHISALTLNPLLAGVYIMIRGWKNDYDMSISSGMISGEAKNVTINGLHLAALWLMICVYILLLYVLYRAWNRLLTKARYTIGIALLYTTIGTAAAWLIWDIWLFPFVFLLIFTLYVGLNWYHVYDEGREGSRYYAVSNS